MRNESCDLIIAHTLPFRNANKLQPEKNMTITRIHGKKIQAIGSALTLADIEGWPVPLVWIGFQKRSTTWAFGFSHLRIA